jgi:two-component system, chemotaxis family, CheB/CheR fusion protein
VTSPDNKDPELDALLEYVRQNRNSDFRGYKRASLTRRIGKRMQALGCTSFGEYLDHLEVDPDEFGRFFDTVLINVTSFFRDPEAWERLTELVAQRFAGRQSDESPIRVWSAGTSSGQEAYTLAMVLAEVLGVEVFKRRVKIYGTDVDDKALATARHASFTDHEMDSLPTALREEYFEPGNGGTGFRSDLRRSVIFGRHDLVQDAPISRLDLLVCRNTLMYLNAETQARILDRFHFALVDDGLLFVGQAETLMTQSQVFTPVDLRSRVFEKADASPRRDRAASGRNRTGPRADTSGPRSDELLRRSFDTAPIPHLVVDASGRLALINAMARRVLRLSDSDVDRPFQDLEVSFRPVELRSSIETAERERRPVVHRDVEFVLAPTQSRYLDIEVMPLFDASGGATGVSLTFDDVTRHRELQEELAESKGHLEDAYEELQSTNEELETTNEELQSTVEELETTNEELQSTNEELETMNEELQSTNDELHVANEELRLRGDQLNEVNGFLESILTALQRGVVVVDRDLVVQIWNDLAADMWGLRRDEVIGKHFLGLDIGLPVDELRTTLRRTIEGDQATRQIQLRARNRRGQPILCTSVVSPRLGATADVAGALLLMEVEPLDDPEG